MTNKISEIKADFNKIIKVIEKYMDKVKPFLEIPFKEYKRRQVAVYNALEEEGYLAGVVFSDEHYCGDVPYLGGILIFQLNR